MLQAHNPNYLKASSPGSSRKNGSEELKDAYDNIDEIPIAELNLDVPLKIHCKFLDLIILPLKTYYVKFFNSQETFRQISRGESKVST